MITFYSNIPYEIYRQAFAKGVPPLDVFSNTLREKLQSEPFAFTPTQDGSAVKITYTPPSSCEKEVLSLERKQEVTTQLKNHIPHAQEGFLVSKATLQSTCQLIKALAWKAHQQALAKLAPSQSSAIAINNAQEELAITAKLIEETELQYVFAPSQRKTDDTQPAPSLRQITQRSLHHFLQFLKQHHTLSSEAIPATFKTFSQSLFQALLTHPVYTKEDWPYLPVIASGLRYFVTQLADCTTIKEAEDIIRTLPEALPKWEGPLLSRLEVPYQPYALTIPSWRQDRSRTPRSAPSRSSVLEEYIMQALTQEIATSSASELQPYKLILLAAQAPHCVQQVFQTLVDKRKSKVLEDVFAEALIPTLESSKPYGQLILLVLSDTLLKSAPHFLPYIHDFAARSAEARYTGELDSFPKAACAFLVMLATACHIYASHPDNAEVLTAFTHLQHLIKRSLFNPTRSSDYLTGTLGMMTCLGYSLFSFHPALKAIKGMKISLPEGVFHSHMVFDSIGALHLTPIPFSPQSNLGRTPYAQKALLSPGISTPKSPSSFTQGTHPFRPQTPFSPTSLASPPVSPNAEEATRRPLAVTRIRAPLVSAAFTAASPTPTPFVQSRPDRFLFKALFNSTCSLRVEDEGLIPTETNTYSIRSLYIAQALIERVRAWAEQGSAEKGKQTNPHPFFQEILLPFIQIILPKTENDYELPETFLIQNVLALGGLLQHDLPFVLKTTPSSPSASAVLKQLKALLPTDASTETQSIPFNPNCQEVTHFVYRTFANRLNEHEKIERGFPRVCCIALDEAETPRIIFAPPLLGRMIWQGRIAPPALGDHPPEQVHTINTSMRSAALKHYVSELSRSQKQLLQTIFETSERLYCWALLLLAPSLYKLNRALQTAWGQPAPNFSLHYYGQPDLDVAEGLLPYLEMFPPGAHHTAASLGLPQLAEALRYYHAAHMLATDSGLATDLKMQCSESIKAYRTLSAPLKNLPDEQRETKASSERRSTRYLHTHTENVIAPLKRAFNQGINVLLQPEKAEVFKKLCQNDALGTFFQHYRLFEPELFLAIDQDHLQPKAPGASYSSATTEYFIRYRGVYKDPDTLLLLQQLKSEENTQFSKLLEYSMQLILCVHMQHAGRNVVPPAPTNAAEDYLYTFINQDTKAAPAFGDARRACRENTKEPFTESCCKLYTLLGFINSHLPPAKRKSLLKMRTWLKPENILKNLNSEEEKRPFPARHFSTFLLHVFYAACAHRDVSANHHIGRLVKTYFQLGFEGFTAQDDLIPALINGMAKQNLQPAQVRLYQLMVQVCQDPDSFGAKNLWLTNLSAALAYLTSEERLTPTAPHEEGAEEKATALDETTAALSETRPLHALMAQDPASYQAHPLQP